MDSRDEGQLAEHPVLVLYHGPSAWTMPSSTNSLRCPQQGLLLGLGSSPTVVDGTEIGVCASLQKEAWSRYRQ